MSNWLVMELDNCDEIWAWSTARLYQLLALPSCLYFLAQQTIHPFRSPHVLPTSWHWNRTKHHRNANKHPTTDFAITSERFLLLPNC